MGYRERDFLAARARASGITSATASSAIEELTGRAPRRVRQFDGGWGAVPFWATGADGTELVVRVGFEERDYATEATAIAQACAHGIPVPDVVGVCRIDDHPVSVLVRARGVPLAELLVTRGQDDPEVVDLCNQAGAWLARLHELDGGDFASREPASRDRLLALASGLRTRVSSQESELLDQILGHLDPLNDLPAPVFTHGDIGSDHVIVDGTEITAIIDWELAARSDPARDVAWWQLYGPISAGGQVAVRAGYGDRAPGFDDRVFAWELAECVCAADFRLAHGDPIGTSGMLEVGARLAAQPTPHSRRRI